MIANIDFSVFISPTNAYGSVSGAFNVSDLVSEGEEISVLKTTEGDWFSGKLKVISVTKLISDLGEVLVSLEDIVAPSPEYAKHLISRLENESGLFFDEYE